MRADDGEIEQFLASRGVGVLGLPAEEDPYLVPMSFGFDGGRRLHFTYLTGSTSSTVTRAPASVSASWAARPESLLDCDPLAR